MAVSSTAMNEAVFIAFRFFFTRSFAGMTRRVARGDHPACEPRKRLAICSAGHFASEAVLTAFYRMMRSASGEEPLEKANNDLLVVGLCKDGDVFEPLWHDEAGIITGGECEGDIARG